MKRGITVAAIACLVFVAAGAGYLFGDARARPVKQTGVDTPAGGSGEVPSPSKQIYTCSMHPQVRLDQPGNCPICGMPLIPAASTSATTGEAPMLQLSAHAIAMASVETVAVERRPLARELRAVGRIEFNESSLATITPRVDGFAERLFVSFTGVEIRKGDHLAEVYSPELLVAQQELLIALQSGSGNTLAEVAKTRLRLLGLTDEQVADLVDQKKPTDRVTLYSPISGTVIEKNIVENAAFKAGDALYRIANLDSVWIYLDIYEYDLPWVRYGQKVRIAAQALPGRTFDGVVTFVQPVVNDQSRTIRVPVYVDNKDHALKPGMFATAVISAALTDEGRAAPTGIEGRYSCPMHPEVLADKAGACPICQMPLEKIPGDAVGVAASAGESGVLAIPVSAVLDSGTRQIVYIEKSRGLFEPRELTLGPRAGEYFAVLAGLTAGERVVTRGNFLIDSQFQVTGHPSLFYPGGLNASMGHQHGATAAPGSANTPSPSPATPPTSPEHKH